ncbi:MAG: hypothetical protein ACOC4K_01300 [Verrucomicrobiota bacterium]
MRTASALIAVFLFIIIASAGILHTFNQTRVYEAAGILEIIDPRPVPSLQLEDLIDRTELAARDTEPRAELTDPEDALDENARSNETLETQVQILLSGTIVRRVEQRLQGKELNRFMAPYVSAAELHGPPTPTELLLRNRNAERVRLSRVVRVGFQHPDPMIAARVANLFMEEYIALLYDTGYLKKKFIDALGA